MADTFYATLELKNTRMEGLLFSFLGKYEQNTIFCDRIWPKETYDFSSQWHFNLIVKLPRVGDGGEGGGLWHLVIQEKTYRQICGKLKDMNEALRE